MKTSQKFSSGLLERIEKGFDSDDPFPKYFQVKKALKSCIQKGILKIDDPVPSSQLLAERFGITRFTVDRAINEMEKESLVRRVQGKGTFVTEPEPELSASEVVGLVMMTTGHLYESFSSRIIRGLMTHDLFPLVVDIDHDSGIGFRRTRMLIEKQPPFLVFDTGAALLPESILSTA